MLTGRTTALPLERFSVARKISVSGGEFGVCACTDISTAKPVATGNERMAPWIVGQCTLPRQPRAVL